jgi:hypothetical protein
MFDHRARAILRSNMRQGNIWDARTSIFGGEQSDDSSPICTFDTPSVEFLFNLFGRMTRVYQMCVDYFNKIHDTIFKYDNDAYNKIIEAFGVSEAQFKIIANICAFAPKGEDEKSPLVAHKCVNVSYVPSSTIACTYDTAFIMFESINRCEAAIDRMTVLLSDVIYVKIVSYGMSGSFVDKLNFNMKYLLRARRDMNATIHSADADAVMLIVYMAFKATIPINYILEREHYSDLQMFFLYHLNYESASPIAVIAAKLEVLKNKAINGGQIAPFSANAARSGSFISQFLRRFNCMPQSRFCSWSELAQWHGGSTFDEYVAKNSTLVVYKDFGANRYIDFDLRNLINADYVKAQKMDFSSVMGINERVVERFRTANVLSQSIATTRDVPFILHEHGGRLYSYIEVFGDKYRFMTPINVDPLRLGISMRPHMYNAICEENVFKLGMEPRHTFYMNSYMDTKDNLPPVELLREKILKTFRDRIADYAIDDGVELAKIIFSSNLAALTADVLYLRIFTFAIGSEHHTSVEIIITFLQKMERLIVEWRKEWIIRAKQVLAANRSDTAKYAEMSKKDAHAYSISLLIDIASLSIGRLYEPPSLLADIVITYKEFMSIRQSI